MDRIDVKEKRPDKTMNVIVYGRYTRDSPRRVYEALYDFKSRKFRTDIISKDVSHWQLGSHYQNPLLKISNQKP